MPEIIDKATAIRGRFLKSVQRLRCLLVALPAADVIVNGDG
jgi:hypothetical protein